MSHVHNIVDNQDESFWTESNKLFDKKDPFKATLLSAEGRGVSTINLLTYAEEHRESFLKLLVALTPERREIAIEYFILRKTEKQIATMHGRKSQSMLGQEVNSIVRLLGATIVLGQRPSIEMMTIILQAEPHSEVAEYPENVPAVWLAKAIASYAACGTLGGSARKLEAKRSGVRAMVREAHRRLGRSQHFKARLLAEYVKGLLGQWNCSHRPRKRKFSDPPLLGKFEVDVANPSACKKFTPRAGQVSNASQV